MLESLSVKNYALIEDISLDFEGGFNILTGETGAGKSIIVGSLSFLLGGKADVSVIRTGAEEAAVSAVLRVVNQEALEWLENRSIDAEDGRLVIRRTIKATGRGSIFIQNVPVSRGELEEFMGFLFDIHGQHGHESLLRKESHRRYLDRFAGLEMDANKLNAAYATVIDKRKLLAALANSDRDRAIRLELLNHAVEEIDAAKITPGEWVDLEAEAARLGDFEKLSEQVNGCAAALYEDEDSVISILRRARNGIENAAGIDSGLKGMQQRLEDLYYEAEDIASEIRAYHEQLRFNPYRLEEVEERLSLLYRLRKKYQTAMPQLASSAPPPYAAALASRRTPTKALQGELMGEEFGEREILAYRDTAALEIESLAGAAENRDTLSSDIGLLEKDLVARSIALSEKRKAGAENLAARITGIIANLGMPNARFSVSVKEKKQGNGGYICGPWGFDEVEFMISANKGEPLKELSRIASGGELSRVMLAIKTALSDADTLETLIFDEIDAGIGGEVALSVGEYLTALGTFKQIFCVTHLASIAVRADNHFKVDKRIVSTGDNEERTVTAVSVLKEHERRQEIARMLAGDDQGSAALAHAEEMLTKYKRS